MKDLLLLKALGLISLYFLASIGLLQAEQIPVAQKQQALNHYVEFANECTHILSGVRKRMERFNQESIQYLASNGSIPLQFRIHDMIENYQFHATFQGPCLWVDRSSKGAVNLQSLYDLTSHQNQFVPEDKRKQLNSTRNSIMYLMIEFLGLCDTLENYTISNRYYDEPELKTGFWVLKRCEKLYGAFRGLNLELYDQIQAIADPAPIELVEMRDMIAYSREILRSVRDENLSALNLNLIKLKAKLLQIQKNQTQLKKNLQKLNLNIQNHKTGFENMIVHANSLIGVAEDFMMKVEYDSKYQVYGKGYFYFNHGLLDVYNHHKYGMLAYYNRFLSFANTPLVKMIEEPPVFIVVYKLEQKMPLLRSGKAKSSPSIASMATRKKYLTPTPHRRPVLPPSSQTRVQEAAPFATELSSDHATPVLNEIIEVPVKDASIAVANEEFAARMPKSETESTEKIEANKTKTQVLAGTAPHHLVFLVDVSSSMNKPEKLSLIREALTSFIEVMRPEDRITLIAYASKATVHLEASSSADKLYLLNQLQNLHAGGKTKIRKGIKLAYKMSNRYFIPKGNNRIILVSDGRVPLNPSTQRLVKKMAWEEIALSTFHLSKGSSDLVQTNLQELAQLGTGRYHQIDENNAVQAIINEARAVLRR